MRSFYRRNPFIEYSNYRGSNVFVKSAVVNIVSYNPSILRFSACTCKVMTSVMYPYTLVVGAIDGIGSKRNQRAGQKDEKR